MLSVNYPQRHRLRPRVPRGAELRRVRAPASTTTWSAPGMYLRGQPDVDPARIGLWGGSYGGYLTAMGLARASDLFAAGVDIHGVHDWNNAIRNFMPDYNAERRPRSPRLAAASSPMAFLDGWRSPVLLIHGDDDRNVPFGESVELVEQLRARRCPRRAARLPRRGARLPPVQSWTRAYTAAADFLDRHLQAREPRRPSSSWRVHIQGRSAHDETANSLLMSLDVLAASVAQRPGPGPGHRRQARRHPGLGTIRGLEPQHQHALHPRLARRSADHPARRGGWSSTSKAMADEPAGDRARPGARRRSRAGAPHRRGHSRPADQHRGRRRLWRRTTSRGCVDLQAERRRRAPGPLLGRPSPVPG